MPSLWILQALTFNQSALALQLLHLVGHSVRKSRARIYRGARKESLTQTRLFEHLGAASEIAKWNSIELGGVGDELTVRSVLTGSPTSPLWYELPQPKERGMLQNVAAANAQSLQEYVRHHKIVTFPVYLFATLEGIAMNAAKAGDLIAYGLRNLASNLDVLGVFDAATLGGVVWGERLITTMDRPPGSIVLNRGKFDTVHEVMFISGAGAGELAHGIKGIPDAEIVSTQLENAVIVRLDRCNVSVVKDSLKRQGLIAS